jgi:hypothetical protein
VIALRAGRETPFPSLVEEGNYSRPIEILWKYLPISVCRKPLISVCRKPLLVVSGKLKWVAFMGRISVAIDQKPLSYSTHVGKKYGSGRRMYLRKWVRFYPVSISLQVDGRILRRGAVAQAAGKMATWKPHEGRWPQPQAGLQLKPPAGCRPKSPAGCRPKSPERRWEATERSCGARAGGDWMAN